METLVAVEQHRNQYYGRANPHGPARFGSLPSRHFRGINCRTFQSGAGILPTPLRLCSTPLSKQDCAFSLTSPKTPSSCANSCSFETEPLKTIVKSTSIPINVKLPDRERSFETFYESFSHSERWAGPAYSNSPPPSSLPIPKFSVQARQAVMLDLPVFDPVVELHSKAKSVPPSSNWDHKPFTRELFNSADSATRTLRRILNLDTTDD